MKTMKSLFMKLFMTLTAIMFVGVIVAIAQTDSTTVIVDPTTGLPTESIIISWFASIGSVAFMTLFFTQLIKTKLNVGGYPLHWLSWAISIVLVIVGYAMHWGMFNNMEWYWLILAGVMSGASANGIANWQLMQLLFGIMQKRVSK